MKTASVIEELFTHNRAWAAAMVQQRPGFFTELLAQQQPQYMWIGCSDSRVPANQITGLEPGEVFVHRNVGNLVVPTDLNCLTALQYAVDRLKVRHVMVVGHYGCGGVEAALHGVRIGLADNWLRHIKDVLRKHQALIEVAGLSTFQADRLCELNVIEQVMHVAQSTVVHDAWLRGQELTLHGWVYGLKDGLLHDLHITVDSNLALEAAYLASIKAVAQQTPARAAIKNIAKPNHNVSPTT